MKETHLHILNPFYTLPYGLSEKVKTSGGYKSSHSDISTDLEWKTITCIDFISFKNVFACDLHKKENSTRNDGYPPIP